jgi:hypothetical protein
MGSFTSRRSSSPVRFSGLCLETGVTCEHTHKLENRNGIHKAADFRGEIGMTLQIAHLKTGDVIFPLRLFSCHSSSMPRISSCGIMEFCDDQGESCSDINGSFVRDPVSSVA